MPKDKRAATKKAAKVRRVTAQAKAKKRSKFKRTDLKKVIDALRVENQQTPKFLKGSKIEKMIQYPHDAWLKKQEEKKSLAARKKTTQAKILARKRRVSGEEKGIAKRDIRRISGDYDPASQIVKDVSKKEKVRVAGAEKEKVINWGRMVREGKELRERVEKPLKPKRKAVRRSAKAMSSTKRVQK